MKKGVRMKLRVERIDDVIEVFYFHVKMVPDIHL